MRAPKGDLSEFGWDNRFSIHDENQNYRRLIPKLFYAF